MRSGSTLLVRHLRQLPEGACFGEILRADFPTQEGWDRIVKRLRLPPDARTLHERDASAFWELVLERTLGRKRWAGSKIFPDHRRGDAVWDRFAEPDHRVFHLWRDSTFDTYVSLELARATGEWQAPPPDAVERPEPIVTFDREAYLRYRAGLREDVAAVRARYASGGDRYLELEYAQLSDLNAIAALLERTFGTPVALEERMTRQRPRPKIEYVTNPSEAAPFEHDTLTGGFAEDAAAPAGGRV